MWLIGRLLGRNRIQDDGGVTPAEVASILIDADFDQTGYGADGWPLGEGFTTYVLHYGDEDRVGVTWCTDDGVLEQLQALNECGDALEDEGYTVDLMTPVHQPPYLMVWI